MPNQVLTVQMVVQALQAAAIELPPIFDVWPNSTVHPLRILANANNALVRQTDGTTLSVDMVCQALAKASGTKFMVLDLTARNNSLQIFTRANNLSLAFIQAQRVLIVDDDGENVTLVSDQAFLMDLFEHIEKLLSRKVRHVFTRPELLDLAISQIAHFDTKSQSQETTTNSDEVVQLSDWLWGYALSHKASDIHIEPRKGHAQIRLRIDNQLHTIQKLPQHLYERLLSRIKVLAGMDVIERRRAQDGRIKLVQTMTEAHQNSEIELRIAILPTVFGEKCVVRIFDPKVAQQSLLDLGFSNQHAQLWSHITQQKNGLILVVGPTGSGKTSTLYNTLKTLAKPEVNVCTIEDPIEMIEPQFNQTQVNLRIGMSFATGLRALLRLDPDILMVGEIRDQETAQLAIQAALTGHLVFSTLHTNSAYTATTRLLDLGVPEYLIKATLRAVLAQRLVRRLCHACKKISPGTTLYEPVGCSLCRTTGYHGRVGVFELLSFSPSWPDAPIDPMSALRQAGQVLIDSGVSSSEEIFSVLGTD